MPTRVELVASISRGEAIVHKRLGFTVMPEVLRLPALRLVVPGEVNNLHRTACLVEFLEDGGRKRSGWLRGAIKFRGNTTLRYPKKSYSLRMEAPHGFLDFSGSKVFYLVSAYPDWSLMRNKLAYDIFRSFGRPDSPRHSPRVHLVEVFINNEYHGIYQMSERVDRFLLGFARSPSDNGRRSVIYKAQHSDARFWKFVRHAYVQVEPNPRDGEYWEPLEELTELIGSSDVERFRSEIEGALDVPTYIDFHILVNVFLNKEGIRFNLYLARGDGEESRFVLIPWDYDKSLHGELESWLTNSLFRRLNRDVPGFGARFTERWRELRRSELSDERVERLIDEIEEQLAGSVAREFARWPRSGTHGWAVREIRDWMRERLHFLDRAIDRPERSHER